MITASDTSQPRNYPEDLERDVVSDGDLHYRLRPIRPDDAERLVQFHTHLSPQSCYLRFFSFHPTLSAKEVERFTCVDYFDRLALVAELVDGTLIAVARYDRYEGNDRGRGRVRGGRRLSAPWNRFTAS